MSTMFRVTTRASARLLSNPLSRTESTSTAHRATFHETTQLLFHPQSWMESMFAVHRATSRHPSLRPRLSPSSRFGGPLASMSLGSLLWDTPRRAILCVLRKAKLPAKHCHGQPAPAQCLYVHRTWKFGAQDRLRCFSTSKTIPRHRQPALPRPNLQGESRAAGSWFQESLNVRSLSKPRDSHWRFSRLDCNPYRSTSESCRENMAQRVCLVQMSRWFVVLLHKWETYSQELFSRLPAPGDHRCHLPLGWRTAPIKVFPSVART